MNKPMRLRAPRRMDHDDDRLVPLINVVFLMLIFFMLVGSIEATDPARVEPPESSTETPRTAPAVQVLVDTEARTWLVTAGSRQGPYPAPAPLEQAVREALAGLTGLRQVEVRAHRELQVDVIGAVIDAIRRAGADEVRLVTTRR